MTDGSPQVIREHPSGSASRSASPLPRRRFLSTAAATVVGAVVALFPMVVGLFTFFDPLGKRKRRVPSLVDSNTDGQGYIKVATVDALPDDGTPQLFKVVSDHVDAWTYFPNEPVGAVFLRKVGDPAQAGGEAILAFNSSCPHAGCAVAYRPGLEAFRCPCHNSSFSLMGVRSPDSPSARNLDELEVDVRGSEVWVKFQDYRKGTAEKIPLA